MEGKGGKFKVELDEGIVEGKGGEVQIRRDVLIKR